MKKLMTSTIILLPLIILAILLVSGAIKALTTHIYVDRVEFAENGTLVLVMDDEGNPPAHQLEVNVLPLKAENRGLLFSTDDESIAAVDEGGRVVAKFYGETYINVMSAEDPQKKDRRRVLVTDDAVHKIEIAGDLPTDLYEADTKQLSALVFPREAKEGGVRWSTSDPGILAVSETGIIEARGYGEAIITATSVENEKIFDTVTIRCHSAIDEIRTETGVRRVETALERAQFPKIIQSPLSADVTIAYTSDAPDIAVVDENGQITFSKAGKAIITATATDFGNTKASVSVEYLSTLHYYRLPLFEQKMYTVDFDEYFDATQNIAKKPLDIPFAAGFEPENTNQKVIGVEYSITSRKVLEFDAEREEFRFVGEMPDGATDIKVTVTAEVYDTQTDALTQKEDAFTLTVQRKAQRIAVGYRGTESAQRIVLSESTLLFGTESDATAPVSVFPSNHTDKLYYTLENAEGAATLSGGTLTFRETGTVNVLVSCKYTESGETHAKSRITVSYAPATAAEHKKPVTFAPPQGEGQQPALQVVLSMQEDFGEEGILYFAEPAGTTVTYAVEGGENAAVELKAVDGVQHILPKRGGFATVTVTVTPAPGPANALFPAPANGEPDQAAVYTAEIYVDKHISEEDLCVKLNGEAVTGPLFCTTGTSVSYEFTAADPSAMAGKVLYVTYGGLALTPGEEDSATVSGEISFPEGTGSLAVTFGVKYGDRASESGAKETLPAAVYTLKRNAERITFSYKGTAVFEVATTSPTLTFKTGKTAAAGEVYVEILPAEHTDTVKYSLTGNNATIDEASGELKFTGSEACTVTVKVQLVGQDGKNSLSGEIKVHYTPRGKQDREVALPEDDQLALSLLLFMNGTGADKGKIGYVVPAGAQVECTAQNGVVSVAEENGEWTITPQKGGFDTVKFKVTGENLHKEYTVNVYVNRAVTADTFDVTLQDTVFAEGVYGTAKTEIAFTVTVNCTEAEGAMEGKQLYVKYNGAIQAVGEQSSNTFTGTISFPVEKGTLPVEFGVQYTSDTSAYAPEESDDVALCSVIRTLARNAERIAVLYGGVEIERIVTKDAVIDFGDKAKVAPEAHTDALAYTLEEDSDIAAMEGSKLTFKAPGTVTVIIKAVRGDRETCRERVTITYEPLGDNREITLSSDSKTQYAVLNFGSEEGRIYFTAPKGATVTYAVTKGNNKVITAENCSGILHILPKTGGFATVTATVEGEKSEVYTVNLYVDAPVTLSDFSVKFNSAVYAEGVEFRTSKTSVTYIFAVTNKNNAREGKEVHVTVDGAAHAAPLSWNRFTQSATFQFDAEKTEYTFVFSVQYTADMAEYGKSGTVGTESGPASTKRTVITTNGKLNTAPDVTYDGGKLHTDSAASLSFEDVDEKITFTVDKASFDPADFQLSTIELQNITNGVGYLELSVSGNTFTLTAKKSTNEQTVEYRLNIGSQLFKLNIRVKAKAQEIQVTCGKTVLGDGQKYKTLLGELTFTAKAGRLDGEPVTAPALEYKVDGGSDWQPFEDGRYTLRDLKVEESAKGVEFRTTDGSDVLFRLLVERVQLADFSMEVRIDLGDGNAPIAIGREKSVLDAGGTLQYVLPARMAGTVALYIVADGEYLGGFGTDAQFKEIIPAAWQSADWTVEHSLISTENERFPHANINLVLPSEIGDCALLEIGGGEHCRPQCTLQFTSGTSLAWIEFPGFDGSNSADVYKGYQQVRVLAKHSDYKVGEEHRTVDYFRIPVTAYADMTAMKEQNKMADLTALTWKLTSYTDEAATDAVVVTQTGNTVTYNGVTYNIAGEAGAVTLQLVSQEGAATTIVNADGTYAKGQPRVPWVDPISEAKEGYVRVYFGEFKGLSESDVKNDLFGNFGEKKGWSRPEEQWDIKGKPVAPSAGAFSFLRLEGGDGAVGGVNAHFNFNVLEDPDENAANNLVNVFDAAGYYKHNNLVLQENLYGEGELTGEEKLSAEAEAKGLYLRETGNLGKTLLYGNGYQVNLEAFNASIVADMAAHPNNYPNGYNESRAVTFDRAYNAVIKGSNPKDELSGKIQTTNLHMAYAYYCDLSYYYKFNPEGNTFCTKNTVFSCIPKTAVQLYYDGLEMYAENIVMTECGTSIQADNTAQQNIKIYYKGAIDILNYFNQPMLSDMNTMVGGFFGEVVPNVTNYFEWHGQNIEANASTLNGADKIYVNILAFAASDLSEKVFVWDGSGYGNTGVATLNNGAKIVSKTLVDFMSYHYYAATYETVDANGARLDNATINFANNQFTGRADLDHLFEGDRIRLQCQFKDVGVKNYEHIKWHKQEVYRDKSLLEGRKTHAEDLRDSLKNTRWADGSYVDGGGAIHPAAEQAALLSDTVIPTKRTLGVPYCHFNRNEVKWRNLI